MGMARFKEGDRVRIKAREPQGKEVHEGRYAPHLGGTTGTILKVYTPQEVAVDLDIESLPEPIRLRHAEQQSAMHEKWLNSLSDEARGRLTEQEKSFRLRYVVLVAESDLEPLPISAPEPTTKRGKTTQATSEATSETPKASKPAKTAQEAPSTPAQSAPSAKATPTSQGKASKSTTSESRASRRSAVEPPTPPRPTPEQLDEIEEAYLKSRKRKS